jgi:nucleoid DNA-binding protein
MIGIYSTANYLKTCAQPYLARSSCSDTLEVEELVDLMAKGRTTLSKPDITGCLQLFLEEVIEQVAEGKHVKTPFGSFYLSASGRFELKNQPFTPGEGNLDHGFTLRFRTNKAVEAKIISQARWERIETFDTSAAAVDQVTVVGRPAGENAQAGDTIRITGRRLKFDPADGAVGVFLESASGSYRAAVYADIAPSRIIATLPADVSAGEYDLVVVTMPNGKDLKNGYYSKPLVIA